MHDDEHGIIAAMDEQLAEAKERIAELEAENSRLRTVMYDTAHVASTLGSGSEGWLRGRFMSISNALSAAIGRAQSSHGDQFDNAGNVVPARNETVE